MADRVVKVSLTASVTDYIAGMEKAAKSTSQVGSAAEKLAKQGQSFEAIGRSVLAIGALAAVGVGLAVAKFAQFDKAMSSVQAATHETTGNMAALRDAALDFGASTVFTATEAAGAIEEMSKAGVKTADILGGALKGSLDLAAAGELEVGAAAEIAATAMTQFNLAGKDVPHIADLLAAGAGKAQGSVDDMSQALKQSGLVSAQMGLSLDETVGSLTAFAAAGLIGSDAGTSLRTMLLRLSNPTGEAADLMGDLGIAAYDAQGNFVGMESLAGQLKEQLGGLTQEQRNSALATIFGSDAIRAASVLYENGAEGIADWNDQVNDSGYAAETARIRMDNLAGDIEKLGGAMDTAFIKTGSAANDSLRALVQGATGIVDAIGDLPAPVLATGLALGGLVAAVGLVGGAALLAVPKIAEFKVALTTLGISGGGVARSLGGVTAATVAVGAAFAVWASRQADVAASTAEFKDTLDQTTGAVTDYTRELVAQKLAEKGVFEAAKDAGISQKELTDAVLEGGDALQAVSDKISGNNNIGNFFTGVGVRAGDAARALDGMSEALPAAAQRLEDEQAAAEDSAASTDSAADAYLNAADQANGLQSSLQSLIDTVNEANGVGQDAVSANLDYQNALAAVDDQIAKARDGVEGYSLGLDQSTQVGRDNLAMINDLAGNYQTAAEAQFALDGNTQGYVANLQAGRDAVLQRARDLGATDEQIQFLSDHIVAMPSEKEIEILAETQAAQEALDRFIYSNNGRTITIVTNNVGVRTSVGNDGGPGGFADGGMIPHLAGGSPSWWQDGIVTGPGGPRDDRVSAMLSPGEFVTNAAATRENLPLLHAINSGRYATGSQMGGPSAVSVNLDGMRLRLDVGGREIEGIIRQEAGSVVAQYDKQSTRASERRSTGY